MKVSSRFRAKWIGACPNLWHSHQTSDVEIKLDLEDAPLGACVTSTATFGPVGPHHAQKEDTPNILKWGAKPRRIEPFRRKRSALRAWRRAEDITQLALARRLRISGALMAAFELGTRRPTQDVLEALAKMGFVGPGVKAARARPKNVRKRQAAEADPEDTPLAEW